jgi:tetratricopeptide (TPR) repeat protein
MKYLKPILSFILLSSFAITLSPKGFAQVSKIDSLSNLLSAEKTDSNKVTLLWELAEQYQSFKPDTALQLAQKALLLAQKIEFTEGESRALALLATSQYLLGDYPKALNNYMLKLKIEEKRNSPRNYASALNNIGITYILLEDYTNALEYLYRANATVDATGGKVREELKYNIEVNIGEAYYRMKMPDSASAHFNTAFSIAKSSNDTAALGAAILGEANVLSLRNAAGNALPYYHNAYNYLHAGSDMDILCELGLGMAKVYEKLNKKDSAAYFGNWSYSIAKKGNFLSRHLDAAFFLSSHYYKTKKYDSAFSYLQEAVHLQDSVKGREKIKAAMILSIDEKLGNKKLQNKR